RPSGRGQAIDLGCGEGRTAIWLAMLGWPVTALDMSRVGIERGQAMAGAYDLRVDWVVADLEAWDLGSRAWDLIALVYVHWRTEQRRPLMRRIVDALAPGGHLVIVAHDRSNIEDGHGGPQDPDLLTTPEELSALLGASGLEVIEAREVLRPVTLEPGHGSASVDPDSTVDAIDHVVVVRRPD